MLDSVKLLLPIRIHPRSSWGLLPLLMLLNWILLRPALLLLLHLEKSVHLRSHVRIRLGEVRPLLC